MRAQMASPIYTPVYSALISVVNTKLPEIGELLVRRVVIQFRKAYKRNQKVVAVALSKFIAHLVNQGVAHEILALQVLTLLLEAPTDDSVEVGVAFTKEAGAALGILAPAGLHAVFERFRTVLQEGSLDRRVQYTIEGLFAVRKTKFTEFPSIPPELDLVEEEDRITHEIGLDDEGLDAEELLDVFKLDPEWDSGESAWAAIRREILGDPVEDGVDPAYPGGGGEGGKDHDEHQGAAFEEGIVISGGGVSGVGPLPGTTFVAHFPPGGGGETGSGILDMSETDLVNLRRTIYLTIMSSANFEECVHKLLKMALPRCVHVLAAFLGFPICAYHNPHSHSLPTFARLQTPLTPLFCRGSECELVHMVVECCSQEKTFLKYYGLLGARFCLISREYAAAFAEAFKAQYVGCHRLETNKLRNVAKLFAYFLHTDSLTWGVLGLVRMNEDDTTPSGRIFLKVLFQELVEYLGLNKLRERVLNPPVPGAMDGLFPKDNLRHTRFSINFFTSIGLGALTDDLRAFLKAQSANNAVALAAALL